jgi:IMP dehydrogenase
MTSGGYFYLKINGFDDYFALNLPKSQKSLYRRRTDAYNLSAIFFPQPMVNIAMLRIAQDALTFDDVLLVPAHSTVLPNTADLRTRLTREINLNIPIVSAAMDTVTEADLAIALAQEGGIGFIHKNMPIEAQAAQVRKVKKFESGVVSDPVTVDPQMTIADIHELTRQNGFAGYPVITAEGELVGIITGRDVRFVQDLSKKVHEVMTDKSRLVTVQAGASREAVEALMQQHRIEKVLVVGANGRLTGMITSKDFQKAESKPNACKDDQGRLRVGAAVGAAPGNEERIAALVAAGLDVLLIDSSHGHSEGVMQRIRETRQAYPNLPIIGGNVATAAGARALAEAGVSAVKVGIGPGSICTTRIVTGCGVPQITAVGNAVEALKDLDIPVIADGGIRFSGDIAKALAAGAHCVMMGSMFAGTEESPGEIELFQGRSFKSYRGMGSLGAMTKGSSDRYFQTDNAADKLVPEGIEGRVPYKGKLKEIIHQQMGGLRSAMGLTGSATIDDLRTKAEFVKISGAGIQESHVHDVTITKEAPNYRMG